MATTIVAETTEQTTTVATTEQAAAIATTTVTENPQPATTKMKMKMKMNTGDYVVFLSLKFCSNKLSISLPGSIKIFSSELQNRLSEFSNNMAW